MIIRALWILTSAAGLAVAIALIVDTLAAVSVELESDTSIEVAW